MEDQLAYLEHKLKFEVDSWDLNEAIKNGDKVIVIDARSLEAFDKEHIKGAISMPHRTMTVETTRHLEKDILYVSYCSGIGCNASTKGALQMLKLGFCVKELIGGLDWWKRDGYQTEGVAVNKTSEVDCAC